MDSSDDKSEEAKVELDAGDKSEKCLIAWCLFSSFVQRTLEQCCSM